MSIIIAITLERKHFISRDVLNKFDFKNNGKTEKRKYF